MKTFPRRTACHAHNILDSSPLLSAEPNGASSVSQGEGKVERQGRTLILGADCENGDYWMIKIGFIV